MFGLKPFKMSGHYEIVTKVVKSNTTITKYDPVTLEDNTADLAAAGEQIFGVALATVVNPTGGSLTVQILCGKDIVYTADNDNDTNTFAATGYGAGKFFDITGATGAVLVDTSTASTSGQLACVDNSSPIDKSDASLGLFKINSAETQY